MEEMDFMYAIKEHITMKNVHALVHGVEIMVDNVHSQNIKTKITVRIILKKDIKEKTGKSIYESGSLSFTVMSLDKNTLACLHEIGVI